MFGFTTGKDMPSIARKAGKQAYKEGAARKAGNQAYGKGEALNYP
jgi:hypothetical protein